MDNVNIICITLVRNTDEIHDVIKWKHFPRYWPFVRGIHRSPVNSPHKGQWHGALMFSLISAWINGWVNNREAGDLRRHHAYYGVTNVWMWDNSSRHVSVILLWREWWIPLPLFNNSKIELFDIQNDYNHDSESGKPHAYRGSFIIWVLVFY